VAIPRVFHRIWLGPDPLPDEYAHYGETWRSHHPDWELRLWTEENLPLPLRRPEAAERLRVPTERADILRLEVVWRFGGVHVDADFECLRPVDELLGDASFAIGLAKPERVNGAFFGAEQGHPVLERLLDEIRPREFAGYDKGATGPRFLDRMLLVELRDQVTFLEPALLYPQTEAERAVAYAIHHEARTWKTGDQLRDDLARAEREAAEARENAAKWRARNEQTRDELHELQRSWGARAERLIRRPRRRG
jgi:mannosyltransferase OCH1-like enzyme